MPTDDHDSAQAGRRDGQYVVVARRYRPQTFEDLIGQEHVARALQGAIASNRVGHAYLFTGARGVGKTSAARIFAKALNCVQGPTATPCNRCDVCQAVSTGDDVDVLEIDGASNRGIDEIRELRQNVRVRPSRTRYKIYIIDEVHMLTDQAFNALLKTLEEPPEHVKFLFCTTEAEKIPITILSRCQRFDFAGIQTPSIVARLRQIVSTEGADVEQEALEILARRAAGSMRDSQSLLEQLLSFGRERITTADVHAMLGSAGSERLGQLVEHLVERRPAEALAELDRAMAEGVDIGQLMEQLVGYFRDVMVASIGGGPQSLLHTWGEDQTRVRQFAERLGLETVLAVIQILDHTLDRLRVSVHRRILAELAIVRIARLEDLDGLAESIAALRGGATAAPAAAQPAARPAERASAEPADAKKKPDVAAEPAEPMAPRPAAPAMGLSAANLSAVWQAVLSQVSSHVAEHARVCESIALAAADRVVVTFRPQYTFSKAICERPDGLAKLQKAFGEVSGARVDLAFELLGDAARPAADRAAAPKMVNPQARLAELADQPFVRRACELFDAQPVRFEEA